MFFALLSPGSLKDVLPAVENLTRGPGRSLIRASLLASGILLALGVVLTRSQPGFFSGFVLAVAAVLFVASAVFAIRARRLGSRIDSWKEQQGATIFEPEADDVVIAGASASADDPNGAARDAGREEAARFEATPRDTWMPGVDAAQRAAIAAAGGIANAPYLKDDLRITIVSGLIAAASVPLACFFGLITFLILLF